VDAPTLPPANTRTVAPVPKDETNLANQPGAAHAGEEDRSLTDFLAPPQQPDEIGRLGSYRVLKVLGAGGMGVVFKAEEPSLERLVAIKAMLPAVAASASAKLRFLREAKAAAAIKHIHIVTIFQVGEDRGVPFLAMEFLEGEPLDDRLKREATLPLAETLRIGREMAEGMAAAHERGLIHRDIKPANTWLEGKKGHVKILDFGLARAETDSAHLTQSGAIIGTPAYMSPEQGRSAKLDARCDLWSLGVMLYRMCTGELPFKGDDTVGTLMSVAMDHPRPPAKVNPKVPAGLSKLVMKLLEKDPAKRTASAQEVADALRALEQTQQATQVIAGASTTSVGQKLKSVGQKLFSTGKTVGKKPAADPIPKPANPAASVSDRSVSDRSKNRKPLLLALAGGLVAAIALGIVVFWPTPDGVIRIESDDPAVEVVFDKDGPTIKGADKDLIRLRAGEHGVLIQRGDFKFNTDNFEMKNGDKITLKIEFLKGKMQFLRNDQAFGEKSFPAPGGKADPLLAKNDPPSESTGLAKKFINSLGMEFALVPKGKSWLGGENGKEGTREVNMSQDFYLGAFEVTQEQWQKVMGKNPSQFNRERVDRGIGDDEQKRFPVETVSWDEAKAFARLVNDKVKEDAKEAGWEYRLPTLEQWEYACRGGPMSDKAESAFDYYFDKPSRTISKEQANFEGSSLQRPRKVGSYAPNRLGLYDMHGNVWEWCEGAGLGGSWANDANCARAVFRRGLAPDFRFSDHGLRLARIPVSPENKVAIADKNTPPSGPLTASMVQKFEGHSGKIYTVALSRDGQRALTRADDGTAILWNAVSGAKVQTFAGHSASSVALSADGKQVLTGSDDTAILWDVATAKKVQNLLGHTGMIYEVALSDDGKLAATASKDKIVGLWELPGGKKLHDFLGHAGPVLGLAMSPDGKFVLSGSEDKTAILWDAPNRKKLQTFSGHTKSIYCVDVSGDGKRVLTGSFDHTAILWDAASGQKIQTFQGHADTVFGVALSPDGKRVVTASGDKTVVLWDAASGKKLQTFLGHTDRVNDVAFSGDGARFLSGSLDGTAILWEVKAAPPPATPPPPFVPLNLAEKEAKKLQEDTAAKLKLPVEATNKIGMKLLLIPPAGAALPEAYYLGKYEVTQGEWEKVMRYNPSRFGPQNAKVADTSKFPVEMVSWYDCVEFCNKLSEQEGLKPYYLLTVTKRSGKDGKQIDAAEVKILGGSGYHLPTEAEWEHGCRAGTKTLYHFGDKEADLPDYAWFNQNSQNRTHGVGEKKPNAFGLYDMHGNVWEWCEDQVDPKGPNRVLRGGSLYHDAVHCRAAYRNGYVPADRDFHQGLRVARVPSSEVKVAEKPPPFVPLSLAEKDAKKLQEDTAAKLKLPVEATNKIGMKLMLIPPTGAALPDAYYLGKYEVTQGEWQQVMGYNPSKLEPDLKPAYTNKLPVEQVMWFDCVEFCNKLSEQEGLKPYYQLTVTKRPGKQIDAAEVKILGGNGYHIPTEAQWEHGCRAGTKTLYHFGDKDADLPDYAWFSQNRTHGAGEKKPNAFGLYDMHGNVWEWCEDQFDPKGPARVSRGGGWDYLAEFCRAAVRCEDAPSVRRSRLGFRLARVPSASNKFTNSLGMGFALVPKGKSWLGGGGGQVGTKEVDIPQDFYLGVYEVTQEEWQKIMGKDPSHFTREKVSKEVGDDELKRFPVEQVSWDDAKEFVKRVNEAVKKDGKEAGWEYRLPTEEQWEYACRGGTMTDKAESAFDYYFEKPSNAMSTKQGNFRDSGLQRPCKVDSYSPNRLGLYGMHDNVGEWCADEIPVDPKGGRLQICRGGGWSNDAANCRANVRHALPWSLTDQNIGLRLARIRAGAQASTTFTNSLGMEFALVPKGKSWLGGGNGQVGTKEVDIPQDFYLGVYEVTQEEWQKIMGKNPSGFTRANVGKEIGDDELKRFPVEQVSWEDAKAFVQLVNEKLKKDGNEAGWQYRLPTEQQWEYACRGGPMTDKAESAFDYYFEKPSKTLSKDQANFNETGLQRTNKVGSYPPNRLGLHDMHGNVWEWCEDQLDPKEGPARVCRGGAWVNDGAKICRAACRYSNVPSGRHIDLGFRLARVPVGPATGKKFTNSLGIEFALVPKGKSWLGGGGGKEGTTEVNMAQDFYLGAYLVTQEEWQKIMGKNPSAFNRERVGKEIGDDELKRFPVESVSWDDAKEFVKLLNEKVKKDGKEVGWEYRLPTEQQWEYACRGGPMADQAESAFDFYFEKPTNTLSKDRANFVDSGLKRPSKVGSYPPNRLGLYDLHGNVGVWCLDEHGPSQRGLRGGSWYSVVDYSRAARSAWHGQAERLSRVGLRLARVPSPGK